MTLQVSIAPVSKEVRLGTGGPISRTRQSKLRFLSDDWAKAADSVVEIASIATLIAVFAILFLRRQDRQMSKR